MPIMPTATLDRPAASWGGGRGRGSLKGASGTQPPHDTGQRTCMHRCSRGCLPPTDAGQLPVGVQPLGRVLLDGGNVHAAAKRDQQEQADDLPGRGAGEAFMRGARNVSRDVALASSHAAAQRYPGVPSDHCMARARAPCPLAAARPPGAGGPASLQACQTGPTASRRGRWWPACSGGTTEGGMQLVSQFAAPPQPGARTTDMPSAGSACSMARHAPPMPVCTYPAPRPFLQPTALPTLPIRSSPLHGLTAGLSTQPSSWASCSDMPAARSARWNAPTMASSTPGGRGGV